MPMASVRQVKTLVKSTEEALEKVANTSVKYKFGVQLQLPTDGGLDLEQVKTRLRKLEEALSSFKEESPISFGLEVSHDSEIDQQIVTEANKIFEAKASIQQSSGLVVPATAVERPKV